MFLHPQVLYISFFSLITNIYKDNYDSLSINEQLSTSGLEMLKPVESRWSYVCGWVLIWTSPEYNKVQIISLGFKGLYSLIDKPQILDQMQAMTQYLWSLRFRNSAFPVPIWGRHNETNATQKETGVPATEMDVLLLLFFFKWVYKHKELIW